MVKANFEVIRASVRTAWSNASKCLSVLVFAQNGVYKETLTVTVVTRRKNIETCVSVRLVA